MCKVSASPGQLQVGPGHPVQGVQVLLQQGQVPPAVATRAGHKPGDVIIVIAA